MFQSRPAIQSRPWKKVADLSRARRWAYRLLALAAGAALSFAFAPWNYWWLAMLCPAVLLWLWSTADSPRESAWRGFAFGVGLYSAGTWWLYISIHVFGLAPVWVALLVMSALVLVMASYQAALGYVIARWLPIRSARDGLLVVPAAWVLVEWWRGWFLSGFPWLSLGYSQTDTWLAGLAPVGGVYLLSFCLLTGAGAILTLWKGMGSDRLLAIVVLILPWVLGVTLQQREWTQRSGESRSVAIVQGAISQDMKWLLSNRENILDTYAGLHRQALGADLIVWPESALPDLANLYADYIGQVWSESRKGGSAMLLGVMRQSDEAVGAESVYFNSVLALDKGEPAFYDKRHLVPFGEYFPVPQWVRNVLRLMNLPYSDFTAGADEQPPLQVAGLKIAINICYEDAYPASLNRAARESDLLVTVTNDAWFGRSSARYQHLQIARMRAIESRRFLVRAANDGVSALIGPHGELLGHAREFQPDVLRGRIEPRSGSTPYLMLGNTFVIGALAAVVAIMCRRRLKYAGPSPN
jgi:apolipoprotein N-acyltransferase